LKDHGSRDRKNLNISSTACSSRGFESSEEPWCHLSLKHILLEDDNALALGFSISIIRRTKVAKWAWDPIDPPKT
jgi:hypothetical protein